MFKKNAALDRCIQGFSQQQLVTRCAIGSIFGAIACLILLYYGISSASLLGAFFTIFFFVGFMLFAWIIQSRSTYSLTILIGTGKNFEKIQSTSPSDRYRIISIAIHNTGNKLLSNCEFVIETIGTKSEKITHHYKHNFSLNKGEKIFVPIANYNEAKKDGKIKLYFLHGPLAPDIFISGSEEHHFTLRATSLESPACEMQCIITVDKVDGKLKITKIT